ncbi:MAG: hypothetical protein GVY22_03465 [Gammaproteobacteria bacterium]|jgi:hypothetical protein|nr:hypothetical protein [Gammaproteobacteria bacterium]
MKRLLLLLIVVVIAAAVLMLLWQRISGQRPSKEKATNSIAGMADWLLFVLPMPAAAAALVALVRGQLGLLLGNVLGYGLLLGGAMLVRGAQGGWEAALGIRTFGRLWLPKTLGAGLLALGSGLTAWLGAGHHPAIALIFSLVTLLGLHLVYGIELPLRRRPSGIGAHGVESLRRAEHSIAAIEQASADIHQPELGARLARISALARQILQRVQDDPRDLWRARKFLNVYLDGVQRVVEGYASTHGQVAAPQLDRRFREALEIVEASFREQHQSLVQRDVEDLDVQIEVLTRQLEREGIL